jgi:hypothetical protein
MRKDSDIKCPLYIHMEIKPENRKGKTLEKNEVGGDRKERGEREREKREKERKRERERER